VGKPIRWFQFERDVLRMMESMGFAVEHIAAARQGDNGIDLFATKGSDLEEVNWVIQCKCWHPRRKVSPNVVRELIGVLTGYPQGTRGMVIATCEFSPGAIDVAESANIRLMNGVEFASLSGFGDSAWG
jgi:restriction endonuclease Mrr